jgi:hypothetical protein
LATLQDYTRALASGRDLGGYLSITATSTGAAANEVICSSLIDNTPNISNRYTGGWIIGTTDGSVDTLAGEQRRFGQTPLDSSTGTLYTTRVFSGTPASGSGWDIYFKIPAIRDESTLRDGYRELINEALREMVVPDRISITGVTGQTKYTLDTTTHPWLREDGRIVGIWRPTPQADTLETMDTQDWEIFQDAENLILQIPSAYSTGDTFKLAVLRPANSRLKVSGTWANQSSLMAGLSSAADEAIPAIPDVVLVARELAYAEMMRRAPESEVKYWAARETIAARKANALKFTSMQRHSRARAMHFAGSGMEGAM